MSTGKKMKVFVVRKEMLAFKLGQDTISLCKSLPLFYLQLHFSPFALPFGLLEDGNIMGD